eukprot:1084854-Rhodomonas_salina.1
MARCAASDMMPSTAALNPSPSDMRFGLALAFMFVCACDMRFGFGVCVYGHACMCLTKALPPPPPGVSMKPCRRRAQALRSPPELSLPGTLHHTTRHQLTSSLTSPPSA